MAKTIPPRRRVTAPTPRASRSPTPGPAPGRGRGRPRSALEVQSAGLEARKHARAIAIRHHPPPLPPIPPKGPSRGPPAASPTRCCRHPVPIPHPERGGASPRCRCVARLTRTRRRANGRRDPQSTRAHVASPSTLPSWARCALPDSAEPGGSTPSPDPTPIRASSSASPGRRQARLVRSPTTLVLLCSHKHHVGVAVEPPGRVDISTHPADLMTVERVDPRYGKSCDAALGTPRAPRFGRLAAGVSRRVARWTATSRGPVQRAEESVESLSRRKLHLPVRGRPRARWAGHGAGIPTREASGPPPRNARATEERPRGSRHGPAPPAEASAGRSVSRGFGGGALREVSLAMPSWRVVACRCPPGRGCRARDVNSALAGQIGG